MHRSVSPVSGLRFLTVAMVVLFGAWAFCSPTGATTFAVDPVADQVESVPAKTHVLVLSVLAPVPPGAYPGGGMFLQAIVKARAQKPESPLCPSISRRIAYSARTMCRLQAFRSGHSTILTLSASLGTCRREYCRDFISCWPAQEAGATAPPAQQLYIWSARG